MSAPQFAEAKPSNKWIKSKEVIRAFEYFVCYCGLPHFNTTRASGACARRAAGCALSCMHISPLVFETTGKIGVGFLNRNIRHAQALVEEVEEGFTLSLCQCSLPRQRGPRGPALGEGSYRTHLKHRNTRGHIDIKMQLSLAARQRLAHFFVSVAELEGQVCSISMHQGSTSAAELLFARAKHDFNEL